jgi:serine/threonine protein phosphatase PrpC
MPPSRFWPVLAGKVRLNNFTIGANIIAAGATDPGLRRSDNEDAFLIDPGLGLFVLADGMGGPEAGEVASNEAIAALRGYLAECQREGMGRTRTEDSTLTTLEQTAPDEGSAGGGPTSIQCILDQVFTAMLRANDRVYNINQDRGLPPERSMGTTLTGLVCAPDDPSSTVAFHVGDSRLYRLRDGQIEQLTRDHSQHQDWLDSGRPGAEPQKNILTQGIGPQPHINPRIFAPAFRRGDMLLLCSDGLTDLVDQAQLQSLLLDTEETRLDLACQALIAAANDHGGNDNITVVLVSRP